MPLGMSVAGEFPDKPQMRKILKSPEGRWITEFLIKNNPAPECRGKTALSWNTELLWKPGSDYSNRADFHKLLFEFLLRVLKSKLECLPGC